MWKSVTKNLQMTFLNNYKTRIPHRSETKRNTILLCTPAGNIVESWPDKSCFIREGQKLFVKRPTRSFAQTNFFGRLLFPGRKMRFSVLVHLSDLVPRRYTKTFPHLILQIYSKVKKKFEFDYIEVSCSCLSYKKSCWLLWHPRGKLKWLLSSPFNPLKCLTGLK